MAGILRQNTKRGRLASRYLSRFHKLLMTIAKTFNRSFELGLGPRSKPEDEQKEGDGDGGNNSRKDRRKKKKAKKKGKGRDADNNDGGNGRQNADNSNNAGAANNGRRNGNRKAKKPPADLKCICCGGNHYVSKCPNVPADKKSWSFGQWLDFKNSDASNSAAPKRRKTATVREDDPTEDSTPQENEDGSDEESKNGNSHPRGGRSRDKGPKKQMLNATRRPDVKTGEKDSFTNGADGVVEIAGVEGVY